MKIEVPKKRTATCYAYIKQVNKTWLLKKGVHMGLKLSPTLDLILDGLRVRDKKRKR